MTYTIRALRPEDAPALTAIINHTIRLGGSTAYETEFTEEGFLEEFMRNADVHSTRVVWADRPLAFQGMFLLKAPDAPNLGIGSFADLRARVPGAARALFAETRAAAEAHGAAYIRATLRADNALGLRYYRGLGFVDHAVRKAVPLKDGTPVDRIETRFDLRRSV